jgi:hypothetical protein
MPRCTALSPDGLFLASTAFMIPTYAMLMISSKVPKLHRALTSHGVPFVLCIGWLVAIVVAASVTDASFLGVVGHAYGTLHKNVVQTAGMFLRRWFTCICWLQLLMLDYLLAREVAIDAAAQEVFAVHSLALCFMCGPVGYLSHRATKAVYAALQQSNSGPAPASI